VVQADLHQIAFVTRHYQALRDGSSRVVLAPGLLLGLWLFRSVHPVHQGAVLVCAIGLVFGPLLLRRWLDLRFGRVRVGRFHPLRWDVDLGLYLWLATAYVDLQFGATWS
jgi:hypothetical protein